MRERLLDLLVTHSYQSDPSGSFKLASGKQSTFYIDCRTTTMRGDAMELVGAVVSEAIPSSVQAVGGLTMGADSIAVSVASFSTRHGRRLDAFAVRKQPKPHGLRKWIEGPVADGTVVAVVDDVVTTGGSTIEAIRRCRDEHLRVCAVVILVDRQEGGLDAIRQVAGPEVPVGAIFTRDELRLHGDQAAPRPRSATR